MKGVPTPLETDPVYPKPVKEKLQRYIIKYECDCGARVSENAKECPFCKRVNLDWLENKYRQYKRGTEPDIF